MNVHCEHAPVEDPSAFNKINGAACRSVPWPHAGSHAAVEIGGSSRSPAGKQPGIRIMDLMNLPAQDSHDTRLLQPDIPASSSSGEKPA